MQESRVSSKRTERLATRVAVVFISTSALVSPTLANPIIGPITNIATQPAAANITGSPGAGDAGLVGKPGGYRCEQMTWGVGCADIYRFGTYTTYDATKGNDAPSGDTTRQISNSDDAVLTAAASGSPDVGSHVVTVTRLASAGGAAQIGGTGGQGGSGGGAAVGTVPVLNLLIFPPMVLPNSSAYGLQGGVGGKAISLIGGSDNSVINGFDPASSALIETSGGVLDTVISGTTGNDAIQTINGATIIGIDPRGGPSGKVRRARHRFGQCRHRHRQGQRHRQGRLCPRAQ